jgi:hypothetical protein
VKKSFGLQIVVIDNGFVHVGSCTLDAGLLQIDNCRNVRRWGTTEGLGQLVNGPRKETIADACGLVLVPWSRVVMLMKIVGGWSV